MAYNGLIYQKKKNYMRYDAYYKLFYLLLTHTKTYLLQNIFLCIMLQMYYV